MVRRQSRSATGQAGRAFPRSKHDLKTGESIHHPGGLSISRRSSVQTTEPGFAARAPNEPPAGVQKMTSHRE